MGIRRSPVNINAAVSSMKRFACLTPTITVFKDVLEALTYYMSVLKGYLGY